MEIGEGIGKLLEMLLKVPWEQKPLFVWFALGVRVISICPSSFFSSLERRRLLLGRAMVGVSLPRPALRRAPQAQTQVCGHWASSLEVGPWQAP